MKNKIRAEFNNKIRKDFISKNPYCQYCNKQAHHVHHIIPISKGGDNRITNLVPLCLECHGLIHDKNYNENWKELQKIGIERAKQEGKYKGGKQKQIDKEKYFTLKQKYMQRSINKVVFAKELEVSRPTLDKILQNENLYFPLIDNL